ncbi:hypothetical protein EJB05_33533, partial [Eragrostis curvula]
MSLSPWKPGGLPVAEEQALRSGVSTGVPAHARMQVSSRCFIGSVRRPWKLLVVCLAGRLLLAAVPRLAPPFPRFAVCGRARRRGSFRSLRLLRFRKILEVRVLRVVPHCRDSGEFDFPFVFGVGKSEWHLHVKVYSLTDDGKWVDQGTGHVTIDYIEGSRELALTVVDEVDNDTLLLHNITSDDIYRKQEGTIISWKDPEKALELALSFQEAAGCSYIWENMHNIQQSLQIDVLHPQVGSHPAFESRETSRESIPHGSYHLYMTVGQPKDLHAVKLAVGMSYIADWREYIVLVLVSSSIIVLHADESLVSVHGELKDLPPLELSSLPLMLKVVLEHGKADRTRVAELIYQDIEGIIVGCGYVYVLHVMYLQKKMAPENSIAINCNGQIIFSNPQVLLNNSAIFEKIFSDALILDIIEALENDPEVHNVQRHRKILQERVVFKEAIPIKNAYVVSKIHQTYRIGYIKEFIFPRALDDATLASLNSIIQANSAIVSVSQLLKDDASFIHELITRMKSSNLSAESKSNLVQFLYEFCTLSKSLQPAQRLQLCRDFVSEGVVDIISDMLQSHDKSLISTGTSILMHFINQDRNLVVSYIAHQDETCQEGNSLLETLIQGMSTDSGGEMHCQYSEILRTLMDSSPAYMATDHKEVGIQVFYEKHLHKLIDVIASSSCPKGVTQSTPGSAGVATVDGFLIDRVIKFDLLKPIIDVFVENGDRDNMLHSGVLELLEYIRKENIDSLVEYVYNSFWGQLVNFEHLKSIRDFKLKYQQIMESAKTKPITNLIDMRKKAEGGGVDKQEEDYFNNDSNGEGSSKQATHERKQSMFKSTDGSETCHFLARPKLVGLVDYDDDEKVFNPPPKTAVSSDEDDQVLHIPMVRHSSMDGKNTDVKANKKPKLEVKISCAKIVPAVNVTDKPSDLEDNTKAPLSPPVCTESSEDDEDLGDGSPGSQIAD